MKRDAQTEHTWRRRQRLSDAAAATEHPEPPALEEAGRTGLRGLREKCGPADSWRSDFQPSQL